MRKKKLVVMMLALCMMFAIVGCGASHDGAATESMSVMNSSMKQESSAEVFYDEVVYEEAADAGEVTESGAAAAEKQSVQESRKLIKTVNMDVETKEFDATMAALEEKVAELGGYIENLETYNGSSYSNYRSLRNASFTIRIPKQHLDTFLDTVEGISNVVRRSESVEDVTLTYVDLESHKRVLQAEQERLLELMEKAEAIEDIITIESRLSSVRYQIESMESQLRTYDNKVDYSTIYLNVDEVQELTPVAEKTAMERIADGFVESLQDIRNGLVEWMISFIVNIPYIILWIIVLIIVIVLIKVLAKVLNAMNEKDKARKAKKSGDSGGYTEVKEQNGEK